MQYTLDTVLRHRLSALSVTAVRRRAERNGEADSDVEHLLPDRYELRIDLEHEEIRPGEEVYPPRMEIEGETERVEEIVADILVVADRPAQRSREPLNGAYRRRQRHFGTGIIFVLPVGEQRTCTQQVVAENVVFGTQHEARIHFGPCPAGRLLELGELIEVEIPPLSATNAENQQIAKQTPSFTPKNVQSGVFVLFKIIQPLHNKRVAILKESDEKRLIFIYPFSLIFQDFTSS